MKENLAVVIQDLLKIPETISPFPGSQFPYPLIQSLFGSDQPHVFLKQADQLRKGSLEEQLALVLGLAELQEAARSDKGEFFINDRSLRARLVRLNTTTGWALVWGETNDKTAELAGLLQQKDFQVYNVGPQIPASIAAQVKNLGSRPTSSVYFYQAIVRYPHIYGRIPQGNAHQVSDFIQDYGPGVMFLTRDTLSPEEEALFLGGLSLGIPAIVPSRFTSPYGNVLREDEPSTIIEAALTLPNLRVRQRLHFQVNIPFNFDPAFAAEQIDKGKSIGGTPSSSFIVTNENMGDGMDVVGELSPDVGIEIALGDPRVDITMTDYLEEFAAKLPSYIQGVSAEVKDGCPSISWQADLRLEATHLYQAFYAGLKAHFNVEPVKVRMVFNHSLLDEMKKKAEAFRDKRRQALLAASEETEPLFYACTRCHSFALEHACTITPERPPQCGATRTWSHVKTRALLSGVDSYGLGMRQSGPTLQAAIEKGRCLNREKGEYTGVNMATERFTEGRTKRVFLHSLFEHPHTCCSCFEGVAFYIPEVDGIGLIDATYKGRAPDGRTWDDIANAAAGKQTSGYAAFGRGYMRSPKFLLGDGGWRRVRWMPQRLKEQFASDKNWIVTETDVKNIGELVDFCGKVSG